MIFAHLTITTDEDRLTKTPDKGEFIIVQPSNKLFMGDGTTAGGLDTNKTATQRTTAYRQPDARRVDVLLGTQNIITFLDAQLDMADRQPRSREFTELYDLGGDNPNPIYALTLNPTAKTYTPGDIAFIY